MFKHCAVATLALVLLASPAAAQSSAGAFANLLAEHERIERRFDPVTSGANGDEAALSRLPDGSPASVEARRSALAELRARLSDVAVSELGETDRLSHALLVRSIDDDLESIAFDRARLSSGGGGFDGLGRNTPLRSRADAEAWLARMQAMSGSIRQGIENGRRGVQSGWTQPRQIIERSLSVARATAERPAENSPLLLPFETLPQSINAEERAAYRERALQIIREEIVPAQQESLAFVETELLPAARAGLGVRTLPNGEAYYRYLVRSNTTTDMTPDEVHALGQSEVRRIRAEMDGVIARTGFEGDFQAFLQYLRTDPQFYAKTPEELVRIVAEISRRADAALPRIFGTLPRLTYGIQETPAETAPTSATAGYTPGSMALGQAGTYVLNTYRLDQRPLYEMPALTLHEATPGHHLQVALMQEQPEAPYFRRTSWFTSYVEGWGLYAETLGYDMGMYTTPYEEFGRLSYEMWRACRLVVDTGLHWLGWTVAQARECFEQNTALSPQNITAEVNRYIGNPGQALAYKIGELTFRRLRAEAETTLGDRFDLRAFHDHLLSAGALPMDLVESRMRAWVQEQQGAR
ncbi:DUF885 domain-containing protein [Brevundimonas sp. S30B]|uniref:DUF885 domain-containing protein n=1 Tax=unclassified Brevundimonas TaxID=2622653 RepID=UPI0010719E7D|nr:MULTISPECIES: DUF885 domain-containing protein [unclassified Brevundimonas]QBX37495.1 DUF885 domain-containing protein [Brevundimonas sp. MF30-B]TFW03712.1 DUF885 domain-containing protein [Brevundimonas sp. S30B]